MKTFVLQVRGPFETFGEFICWNDGYRSTRATPDADCAIQFGSKSSAYRFAKRITDVSLRVVSL
jgi:hypothetical protein